MTTQDTTRTGKVIPVLPKGTISSQKNEDQKFKIKKEANGRYSFNLTRPAQPSKVKFTEQKPRPVRTKKLTQAADFIPYDVAMRTANDLLWSGKQPQIGFYVAFAVNTGLRAGDILNIKHEDVCDLHAGDYLTVTEQKTKKIREIKMNDKVVEAYQSLLDRVEGRVNKKDFIFTSQKGTVFAVESLNRIFKELFKGIAPNISTHSLRKSFGRHVYDQNKQSEHALVKLSEVFCHSNVQITRRYLGLTREEIGDIYMNL